MLQFYRQKKIMMEMRHGIQILTWTLMLNGILLYTQFISYD